MNARPGRGAEADEGSRTAERPAARTGSAAVDWVARYLEGVRELPVLAQVEPGDIRDAAPGLAARGGRALRGGPPRPRRDHPPGDDPLEPPALLRLLRDLRLGAGDPRRAPHRRLQRERDALADRPAATELEELALDWLRQLLGLPDGLHGHIEDTASTSTLAALTAARELRPNGAVLCSEHAHSSVEKAARILGSSCARSRRRGVPDAARRARRGAAARTAAVVSRPSARRRRPRSTRCPPSPTSASGPAPGSTSTPPTRARRWSARAPLGVRGRRARGLARRQPAQVALHAGRLLVLCTRRPEDLRAAFSLVPEYLRTERGGDEPDGLRAGARPALPALKLWAVIRCYGREGLQALIREHVRLAQLFAAWVEAEPGWEVVAPVPFSVVCFRREGSDEENEALIERVNATGEVYLSPTELDGRLVMRLAIGNMRTTEADVTPRLGGSPCRRSRRVRRDLVTRDRLPHRRRALPDRDRRRASVRGRDRSSRSARRRGQTSTTSGACSSTSLAGTRTCTAASSSSPMTRAPISASSSSTTPGTRPHAGTGRSPHCALGC